MNAQSNGVIKRYKGYRLNKKQIQEITFNDIVPHQIMEKRNKFLKNKVI